ncbi:MAG: alpha/beta hydrolase [Microbacterium sp.]|uniref:alpha/beta fold hydrolase n=1 Tax=Microbacterium sp. TaxID=51671 RepID=UPI003BAE3050
MGIGLLAGVEAALASADDDRYPAPGTFIEVDGSSVHLDCRGTGSPTVLFEAGLGEPSLTWSMVAGSVAESTRVCSYDRPGYGWSDARGGARDAAAQAGRLTKLLSRAGESGPFVIVAHSYGSLIARIFAADNPDLVSAMLLVEPTNEKSAAVDGAAAVPALISRAQALIGRLSLTRPFAARIAEDSVGAPLPAAVRSRATFLYRAQALETAAAELDESALSARQASEATLSEDLQVSILLDAAATDDDRAHFAAMTADTDVELMAGGHYLHYADPARISDRILVLVAEERAVAAP